MMKRVVLAGLTLAVAAGSAAQAKVERDLLGSYRNWDAFVETDSEHGKACYMASSPIKSAAQRSGKAVSVSRGDIYITVTHRKKYGVKNQVNVVFGYPMKEGTEATLSVDGGRAMSFFTQRGSDGNSTGWAFDDKDDQTMASRMKRGNRLIVRGSSSRGTQTTDTYSLSGFTAAYNAITKACG